jgi:hypothetical protein
MKQWTPTERLIMGGKGSGGSNRKPVERKMRIGNPSGRKLPAVT